MTGNARFLDLAGPWVAGYVWSCKGPGLEALATSRLRIRPFTMDDLDSVARLHDDCFGPAPLDVQRAWLEWTTRNYAALAQLHQPPYGDYAIELLSTREVIGAVGLVPSFGPFDRLPLLSCSRNESADLYRPEMGLFWAIATKHRKMGYASEAGSAMVGFAFGELNLARIVATTEHDNTASIGVMRRLGMRVERNPLPEPVWFQTVGVLVNTRK